MGNKAKKKNKTVSFDTVELREYPIVPSTNPGTLQVALEADGARQNLRLRATRFSTCFLFAESFRF